MKTMKELTKLTPSGKHAICDGVCHVWDTTIAKMITPNDMMAEGARIEKGGVVVVWYVETHLVNFLVPGIYGEEIIKFLETDTDERKAAVAGWKKQYDDVLALVAAEKEAADNVDIAT